MSETQATQTTTQTTTATASLATADQGAITQQSTTLATGNMAFLDSLAPDLRPIAQAKGWKDHNDAIKSYAGLEKLLGGPREELFHIGKEPTAEQLDTVFSKLGRPASPKDYKLSENAAKAIDAPTLEAFTSVAHKLGITQKQAADITDWFASTQNGAITQAKQAQATQAKQAMDNAITNLKQEWGQKFDENMNLAQRALRFHGSPDLIKEVAETGIGNSPAFAKFLVKAAANLKDDPIFASGQSAGFSDSREAAQKELAEYSKPGTPQNKDFLDGFRKNPASGERRQQLYKIIHGEV